ncbi:hypothetical protein ABIB08_009158 [Bradyrhizobium sp. RT11b]
MGRSAELVRVAQPIVHCGERSSGGTFQENSNPSRHSLTVFQMLRLAVAEQRLNAYLAAP